MSILDELAAHARQRVAADREANSLDVLQAQCRALGKGGGRGSKLLWPKRACPSSAR